MELNTTETRYRGFRFRSRLEARHAVFYDSLGIEWCYEHQGYMLENGDRYLPDFWLPKQECFIEIKGPFPSPREIERASLLSKQEDRPVYIFYGSIQIPRIEENLFKGAITGDTRFTNHRWCECPLCGEYDIYHVDDSFRLPCACKWCDSAKVEEAYCSKMSCSMCEENTDSCDSSNNLLNAYFNARGARFEYGEEGKRYYRINQASLL